MPESPCVRECPHGPLVERDRWGRPLIDGVPFTRVSTVAKALDTAGGLPDWKARMALIGAVRDSSISRSMAVALSMNDEAKQKEIARRAADLGGASSASDDGTNLHEQFLGAARGRSLEWADEATRLSVKAGNAALAEAGLRVIQAEQFVVDAEHKTAGTIDMVLKRESDNTFYVGDLKSSRKANDRNFPMAVSIQCAGYAHGQRWCPVNGWLRTPPWSMTTGILLSLPLEAGTAYLDELDLEVGTLGLALALTARDFRTRKDFIRRQLV